VSVSHRVVVAVALSAMASMGHLPSSAQGSDAAAAEAQYRVAQRLAADRSSDAGPAFERVVALAPDGPLADDALVGLARLQGVPDWPEMLSQLDAAHAQAAAAVLRKIVDGHAEGDRAQEARYLLALVRMAPVAGRDAGQAKQDLIGVAGAPDRGRWSAMARYALGVLAEYDGATERAAGSYARVVVEGAPEDAVGRARVGFSRAQLRIGRFGDAAEWLQAAVDSSAPASLRAAALRDLAVRELVRERDPARRWSAATGPLAVIATTRGAVLLATAPDGSLVVFDRKNGVVQGFDSNGGGGPPVAQEGVTALASDPYRRVYVAAGDKLLRWDGAGLVAAGKLGAFAEPAAIAVDAAGAAWIADRRGDRIARLAAGAELPVIVRESKGAGISALAIVDGRLLVAEERNGRVVELSGGGAERAFGPAFRKPVALAADAAGRLSVLDVKAGTVTRLSSSGQVADTLALDAAGVARPLAIAVADDGALRILDGSSGTVAVAP
jgi:hypothetical protein